ncbi:ATP-binding protein [Longimicrobium sp.]|uniref:PAS domain-containing sensor histidine kinase n=1 Tax=Longimicrobium sp. TaxID=2029185 RepID=UPI003B3A5214
MPADPNAPPPAPSAEDRGGAPHQRLGDQLVRSQAQVRTLRERSRERGIRDALVDEAVEALHTALEELRVTEEELRIQNEQLEESHAQVAAEWVRYEELFQLAPDAYLVTDPGGVIAEANHAAAALLNVPGARLRGKPLAVFVPGPQRRDFRNRVDAAVALGRLDEWETWLQPRGTAAAIPVSCTVTAVHDASAGATGLRWLVRDVTERRRGEADRAALVREEAARAEAQRQRAFLEAVLRQMPGGVLIAEAPDGRIVMHNDEAERILRHPLRAVRLPEYGEAGMLRADGSPLAAEEYPLARVLLRGETVVNEEVPYRLGDGTLATLRVNASPVLDAEGHTVAAVSSFTDVTEELRRLRTEHVLAEVGEVLSSSLEPREIIQQVARLCAGMLADYCIVHVEEGDTVRAHGIAHADRTREELVRGVLRRFPIPPGADQPVMRALRTGEPEMISVVDEAALRALCTGPDHVEMVRALGLSSAIVVPIRAKGRTLGALSLARTGGEPYDAHDLALVEEVARRAALAVENARLYETAQQAVRARDEVVAVVSHDLRNPLNAVLIASTVLAEYGDVERLSARDRKQLDVIRRSAEQMTALVQDLLEVSSLESGSMQMNPRPCAPSVLVGAAEEMFRPLAEEKGVALVVGNAADIPPAQADYGRTLQVFGNLVGNAIKFTPAGGQVQVGAERAVDYVRFWVRDTGPGIEREHLPRLFDRFWQARRGGKAGAGLGLAIAKSIVEGHGGQIWVESAPGEGSTFHFTLPVAPASPG